MPVLFLTARDALTDRLSGFHAGGDDYLTKPFALAELVVRVGALLKRAAPAPVPGEPETGALVLDPASHGITGDPPVALTPTEFRVLGELAAKRGTVVRRVELIRAAWPDGAIVSENTLDAYISRIRTKLRKAGREEEIANVRGVGYVLK
jgi:two-component system response regulator MprA